MDRRFAINIAITCAIALLAAISQYHPEALGIPRTVWNWIPILLAVLGVLAQALQPMTRGPAPEAYAEYGPMSEEVMESYDVGKYAWIAALVLVVLVGVVAHIKWS